MMEIEGDLLDITEGVILHQVNCIGATGGLAGALRRKWPKAFGGYIKRCELVRTSPRFALGNVVVSDTVPAICHVFGQVYPGPSTDMEAVDAALMVVAGLGLKGPIYAPWKMGCGLGGGNWDDYRVLLEKHLPEVIIVRRRGER